MDLHRIVHLHVRPGRPGRSRDPLPAFAVTWQPARLMTFGIVSVSQANEAGRFGWAHALISVSAISPCWKSNSRLTVRKYLERNL